MIKTEKRKVPARFEERIVETRCDLCKERILDPGSYGVEDVTVSYEEGTRYPSSVSTTTLIADICKGCFLSKVKPWLESQGAEFRTEESDW